MAKPNSYIILFFIEIEDLKFMRQFKGTHSIQKASGYFFSFQIIYFTCLQHAQQRFYTISFSTLLEVLNSNMLKML